MENKFFLHQIKRTNGTIDKGIVVKDTLEGAKQSYHAYLGAYAYGQSPETDFVSCFITDLLSNNMIIMTESWLKPEPEPEPEPKVEPVE